MLLGVSGSVAAIKVPIIAKLLSEFCEVIVIATDASRKLLQVEQLESMHLPVKGAPTPCYTDKLIGSKEEGMRPKYGSGQQLSLRRTEPQQTSYDRSAFGRPL